MRTERSDGLDYVWLAALVFLGLGIRLWFLVASEFIIDSDEAIVGLMAKHILETGVLPIFYYGQHYMGSLEPITAAVIFWFFGQSSVTLHLAPLAWFVATQITFYTLCKENMNYRVARLAGVLFALAPVGFIEWSAKARGGFIEVIFLSVFALLFFFRALPCNRLKQAKQNLLIGSFLLGVGWWTNNQIIYVFPACGLVFLCVIIPFGVRQFLGSAAQCLFIFLLGGLPYWIYNVLHPGASFGMFHVAPIAAIFTHAAGMWSESVPILLGAKAFYQPEDIFLGASVLTHSVFIGSLILAAYALLRTQTSYVTQLFFLTSVISLAVMGAVFSISNFGFLFLAPRYLLPFYIFYLPITTFFVGKYWRSTAAKSLFFLVLSINLASVFWGFTVHISGQPIIANQERVSKDNRELIDWLNQEGIHLVRTNYWIGYRLAFESNESVKFVIYQNPREARIKSYENLIQSRRQLFETPLVVTELQAQYIREAFSALSVPYRETHVSGYSVFDKLSFPWLDNLCPIKKELFTVRSDINPADIPLMLDGDETTRWATHMPQNPKMHIDIDFKEPQSVRFIDLDIGIYGNDYPRILYIQGSTSKENNIDQQLEPVYTEKQSKSIQYFVDSVNESGIFIPAKLYTHLRLNQVGIDRVFDWSIAELKMMNNQTSVCN